MFESSIRVEECELYAIMTKRKEIRTILNELLDEAPNSRIGRTCEKQPMEKDVRAKRSLGIEKGSNGGESRLMKKVTSWMKEAYHAFIGNMEKFETELKK